MNQAFWIKDFSKLNRGSTKFGKAPHKPILLLTLLDLMDQGEGFENKFFVNAELVGSFHENWSLLVRTGHQEDFTQPFYYLQNDRLGGLPFWKLFPKPGYSIQSHIKSIHVLSEILEFASFSEELFVYLKNFENRSVLRRFILETYFGELIEFYYSSKQTENSYLVKMEGYILNEISAVQKLMVAEEEIIYVRNGIFKKWVPRIYQNTCAISGMRLVSTFGYNLIDACHIVPFSESQDDRVTNGIALCPNLHRAFDRGLISINGECKVIVSNQIQENISHPYGLSKLNGIKVLLPSEKHHYPDQENLEWHRKSVFKT